jgi:hypothetical protein
MHPYMWTGWVEVTAFACAACGRDWRMQKGTIPTDAKGQHLYCPYHDEGPDHADPCGPFDVVTDGPITRRQHSYYWCENGKHVSIGTPCSTRHSPWLALRPNRPQQDCQHCGTAFAPARSDARYCSGRCRVAAHRARRREAA